MSDVANLNIIIGANATQATQQLDNVSKKLAETAVAATKVDSSISKSSQTFTNWGRVIQDLPFGFQGIQNNLTQLIPAVGGLGLAFSAIISAITFLQVGFSFWTRGLKENKAAIDEEKKSTDELIKSAGRGIGELNALTKIVQDNSIALSERLEGVKKLQELSPDYFGNLSKEKILYGDLTTEIQNATKALFARAVVEQKTSDLGPVAARIFDLKQERDELEKQEAVLKRMQAITGGTRQRQGVITSLFGAGSQDKQSLTDLEKQIATIDKELLPLQGKFKGLSQAIIDAAETAGKGLFDPDKTKKVKDVAETIAKILSDLNAQLTKDNLLEQKLGLDETQDKMNAIQQAIERLLKINVDPNDKLINKLFGDLQDLQAQLNHDKFNAAIHKLGTQLAPIDIKINFVGGDAKGIKPTDFGIKNPLDDLTQQILDNAAVIQDTLTKTFESIGDVIGDALVGKENPFKAFFLVFAEGIKKLGENLIKFGALALLAKRALSLAIVNPALAIGVGIALEALSRIIQGQGVGKFAAGGIVTRPTLLIAGESGPEKITPLGSQSTGNILQGDVRFRISGNELLGILKIANRSANTFQ